MYPDTKTKPQSRTPLKLSELRERACVSVTEWCGSTGISKPTAYRMMADGRLKFVRMGERIRKIPTTEYERLGLVAKEAG